jgi:hypothetical protein
MKALLLEILAVVLLFLWKLVKRVGVLLVGVFGWFGLLFLATWGKRPVAFLVILAGLLPSLGIFFWERRELARIEGERVRGDGTVMDGGTLEPAAAGFVAVGVQVFPSGQLRYEQVHAYQVISAGNCANIDTAPVPLASGGTATYYGQADFNCDGVSGGGSCDAGACTTHQVSAVSLDLHGGQCCVQGGSLCTNSDGGGLSSYVVNNPTTNTAAPAYGVSSQIVCNANSGTIQLQACAGANQACSVAGVISQVQAPSLVGVDAGQVPTLVAPTYPFYVPANPTGATPPLPTLIGTNLSSSCTASVYGVAASATFTATTAVITPTNSVAATSLAGNITVSCPAGNATLSNVVRVLPVDVTHAWHCGQGFVSGTSWTDLVGGVVATHTPGMTNPTTVSAFGNSCGVQFTGTMNVQGAFATQPQPDSIFAIAAVDAINSGSASDIFDSLDGAAREQGGASGPQIYSEIYAGSNGVNGVLLGDAGGLIEFGFGFDGGSGGYTALNGGAFLGATAIGTQSLGSGITIGSRYDGNTTVTQGLIGYVGLVATLSQLSASGDRTVLHGDSQGQWGFP